MSYKVSRVSRSRSRRVSKGNIIHISVKSPMNQTLTKQRSVDLEPHNVRCETAKSSIASQRRISFHSKNSRSNTFLRHPEKSLGKLKQKRIKTNQSSACPSSPACILISILAGLLLSVALATLLVAVLVKSSTTTQTTLTTTTATTTTTTTRTTTTTTTSTTSSTSSSTTSTTSTTSTSTTTSTTATTTTTTTTTTRYVCLPSCANRTWISSSNLLAKWSFDGNTMEFNRAFNAVAQNNPSYVTNGYVDQSISFSAFWSQYLITPLLSLVNTSFTIEAWIKYSSYSSQSHHSIFGVCPILLMDQCLYASVFRNVSGSFLYLGFYQDDCRGSIMINTNVWTHVAFVFDMTTLTQSLFVNGIRDNNCTASSPILRAVTGNNMATIGYIPNLSSVVGANYFQGEIDELLISTRVKPDCEILEDATLSAHFKFDSGSVLIDSGPNMLTAISQGTLQVSSGHFQEAITFNGSTFSFFQIAGVTSIGLTDKAFTISFWIRPTVVSGVLVHISSAANGGGWCIPFLGFSVNDSILAQVYSALLTVRTVYGPKLTNASIWTHIVETWSSTTGLRIYIDGVLISALTSFSTYSASTVPNYVTIASMYYGFGWCIDGDISPTVAFNGAIDDFRIYSRALTADDVCALFDA